MSLKAPPWNRNRNRRRLSNPFLSSPFSRRSPVRTGKRRSTRSWSVSSACHPTSHKKLEISWNGYGLVVWSSHYLCLSITSMELLCKYSSDMWLMVVQLLKRNASSRLGAGAGDATEVQVRRQTHRLYCWPLNSNTLLLYQMQKWTSPKEHG